MTLRAITGRMQLNSVGVDWGNAWHYRTSHPIEAIEAENYFLTIGNNVSAADVINVLVDMPDGGWAKAAFEVLWSEKDCVTVERIGEWRNHGMAMNGPLEMLDRGDEKFDVIETRTKRTIRRGLKRLEAQMWVSSRNTMPELVAVDPTTGAVSRVGVPDDGAMSVSDTSTVADTATMAVEEMHIPLLQKEIKRLTGSGWRPGELNQAQMRDAVHKARMSAQEREVA